MRVYRAPIFALFLATALCLVGNRESQAEESCLADGNISTAEEALYCKNKVELNILYMLIVQDQEKISELHRNRGAIFDEVENLLTQPASDSVTRARLLLKQAAEIETEADTLLREVKIQTARYSAFNEKSKKLLTNINCQASREIIKLSRELTPRYSWDLIAPLPAECNNL